jgi:DNA polymerase III subunit epsilon
VRGLFWDLETTSLDTKKARIIQGAYSVYDLETKQELNHVSALVWDETYPAIETVTTTLTGITELQLREYGMSPFYFLKGFLRAAENCDVLVSHNGFNYDIRVLKEEMKRYDLGELPQFRHIDTRFDLPYPGHITTRKLSYLAAEHGFTNFKAHGARHDVDCMARLFFLYPTADAVKRAETPFMWVRADVDFNRKDLAKNLGYFWDGINKLWIKVIRESDFQHEKDRTQDKFRVIHLERYEAPDPKAE